MDWGQVFGVRVPVAELLVRGTVMYLFLYALFRVVIRRRVGAIGMADLLVLVIIADAAQNGMAGEYTTVTEAAVLVCTIVAWNHFFDWLGFRFPRLETWLQPPPLPVVHRGRILRRNMRLELISEQELLAKLREHGVQRVEDVERALIEPDGQVTVIPRAASGHPERGASRP
jgi:uncharacterized membrane protein YcaP (DUF421 family)